MWQLWDTDSTTAATKVGGLTPPTDSLYDPTHSIVDIDDDETESSWTLTNLSDDDDDDVDDKMFYEDVAMHAKREEEVNMLLETDDDWIAQMRYQRQLKEAKQAMSTRLSRSLSAFPPSEQIFPLAFPNPDPSKSLVPLSNTGNSSLRPQRPHYHQPPVHSPSSSFAALPSPSMLHVQQQFSSAFSCPTSPSSSYTSLPNPFEPISLSTSPRRNLHSQSQPVLPTSPTLSSLVPPHQSQSSRGKNQKLDSLCRYFAMTGFCRNGNNCMFRHAPTGGMQVKKKGKILFKETDSDSSTTGPKPRSSTLPTVAYVPVSSSSSPHGHSNGHSHDRHVHTHHTPHGHNHGHNYGHPHSAHLHSSHSALPSHNTMATSPTEVSSVSAPSSPRSMPTNLISSVSAPNSPSKHGLLSPPNGLVSPPPGSANGRKSGLPSIVCKFYSVGKCRKGDSCPFVHHTTQRYQLKAAKANGSLSNDDLQLNNLHNNSTDTNNDTNASDNKNNRGNNDSSGEDTHRISSEAEDLFPQQLTIMLQVEQQSTHNSYFRSPDTWENHKSAYSTPELVSSIQIKTM